MPDLRRRVKVRNEFANPRAANDLTGWAGTGGATLSRVGDADYRGDIAVHVAWNDADGQGTLLIGSPIAQAIPALEGDLIYFRLTAKAMTALSRIEVYMDMYNGSAGFVGNVMPARVDGPEVGQTVEIEGLAPVSSAAAVAIDFAVVGVGAANTALAMRVSDVMIVRNPRHSVPGYCSGDEPGCAWTGAAHASPSEGNFPALRPSDDFYVGFHDLTQDRGTLSLEEDKTLTAEAGMNAVRIGVSIADVAPVDGGPYDFSAYDDHVEAMLDIGAAVLFMFGLGPRYMTPGVTAEEFAAHAYAPTELAKYAAACAAVVDRYADLHGPDAVIAAEIWNEPNLGYAFWWPTPDPVAYTALLAACHGAINAVQPTVPVLGGSLSATVADGATWDTLDAFLRAMYVAGAKNVMDGVAIHPYPFGPSTSARLTGASEWRTGVEVALRTTRKAMADNGDSGKPLWLTEFGINLLDNNPVVTEGQAGRAAAVMRGYFARQPDVAALIFHELVDHGQAGFDFGFVDKRLRRRPAFRMVRDEQRPSAISEHERDEEVASLALRASWGNLGVGFSPARRRKDAHDWVALEGVVDKSTPVVAGEVIADLPIDWRPPETKPFVVAAGTTGGPARVDVTNTGQVVAVDARQDFYSLDGIRFKAER